MCRRFSAPGTSTNYEMESLREQQVWRGVRWRLMWSSLADPFHPHTLQEWQDRSETLE